MILAPLRGVTIRAFREIFAAPIVNAGFREAITPFIPAMSGVDPLKDPELKLKERSSLFPLKVTPQFIGKDPVALRTCLERVKATGYDTADLNCGCPFPMVRNKGRGSGILRTPEVLDKMLAVGCEVMGAGCFSIKARLGVERKDELMSLMPIINRYPLRYLTVHGRVAKAMYEGEVDREAMMKIVEVAKMPVVLNGDITLDERSTGAELMIGRAFIRSLGEREDIGYQLKRYIDYSRGELFGDKPVLGRMKELIAYWKELPEWRRRWQVIKLCRTITELEDIIDIRPVYSRVLVSLGSNIEPRMSYMERAKTMLEALPDTIFRSASSIVETEPVDVPAEYASMKFLNQVLVFESALDPFDFSRRMHAIEDELGRVRTVKNGPRTIDIDLLKFGDYSFNTPELVLPHQRALDRPFMRELLNPSRAVTS